MPRFLQDRFSCSPQQLSEPATFGEVRVTGSLSRGRWQHRSHTMLAAPAAALAVTFPFITTARETHCAAFKGNFTLVCTNIYPTCFLPGPAPGLEDAVGHRQRGRGSSGEPAASHTESFGLQGCVGCSGPSFSLVRFHTWLATGVIPGVASPCL